MTGLHHLVVGPPGHGVVRYAELLLAAAGVPDLRVLRVPRRIGADDVAALLAGLAAMDDDAPTTTRAPARVHVHVTDHLLGRSPEQALQVVQALARRGPVSLTLHDLPQPSDGTPATRRRDCYAGLVEAAIGVVVSSDHEAALLDDVIRTGAGTGGRRTPVRVVPLAVPLVDRADDRADDSAADPSGSWVGRQVAVLGWVYPGKGHAEVLAALDGLPADVGLRVLGGASPGHDDLLVDLAADARGRGRALQVDGWVADDVLPSLLRRVAVPVFAPRHVSASASLTAWASAGRRPVTRRSAYTEEVHRRAPGALMLVDDDPAALAEGIRVALADPGLTRLDPAVVPGPAPAEAARLSFAGWGP